MTFEWILHPARRRMSVAIRFLSVTLPLFPYFFEGFCLFKSAILSNIISIVQVGSLQACYMAKRGHQVDLYELRDGWLITANLHYLEKAF